MAIVFNATPGDPAANSYPTLEQADDYLTDARLHVGDEWTTLSAAEKEAALMWATREIERFNMIGNRSSSDQALHFPSDATAENNGRPIPAGEIPASVIWATSELAYFLAEEDRSAIPSGEQKEKIKVGPIEISYRNQAGAGDVLDQAPKDVKGLLKNVLKTTGIRIPILRA
jgi:hypothetical protein